MHQDLLFEIGTEEIPARFMGPALDQLNKLAKEAFEEARLDYRDVSAYGTPRRLTLYVSNLATKQKEEQREIKGPAKKAAFDEAGNPTKAAQGFARGQGITVEQLVVKKLNNIEYVYALVKDEGRDAKEILPQILQNLIVSLSFPKPMRWGSKEFRFVRPIHWLVALFGEEIIPVTIEGLSSDRFTRGHRFLSDGELYLNDAKVYFETLKKAFVVVNQTERGRLIQSQLRDLEAALDGEIEQDQKLLEEVIQLVEYPTSFMGSFDTHFLELPEEVIITAMKEHQRYFPVRNKNGKLLPKFLAVRNGTEKHLDLVRAGNEKVLAARLADAHFFYAEDLKEPLENKVEGLKDIVFLEKLGTLWEKTLRIQKLSLMLAQQLNMPLEVIAKVQRAAFLSKGDLTTNMVNEFPELQGIMGGYYALKTEDPAVALGIREHYLPRFAGDKIPESQAGILVGIADKVDTLVGCFLAGLIPTGSQDPLGLRRQALGVCNTIIKHQLPISLQDLVKEGIKLYGDKFDQGEVLGKIIDFYRQRIENILQEDQGIPYDVVAAVLEVDWEYPFDVLKRAKVLYGFMGKENFLSLITGFTRAFNLTKNTEAHEIEENLLLELSEKELYKNILTAGRLLNKYLNEGDYKGSLEVIATLREPIDQFFEEVMVMVEDEQLKQNRLALLHKVVELAGQVADLSKLVTRPN
ncbi:MAG: glycine--tRNA ligase subunit beta [Bacillota bacterium]